MNKLKYALIGAGRIAVNHINAYKKNIEYLELVAICDLKQEAIDLLIKKTNLDNIPQLYKDYKVMLAKEKIDLIAIATDSGSHAEISFYALKHHCHVIVEKPIALGIQDANNLIVAAKENKKLLAVCHQNRFNLPVQKVWHALSEKRFGKLSHIATAVRWNRDASYYSQAVWRGKWSSDGGCLMNQCIHSADLLCWFLGEIDEVFAYTARQVHPYIEVEDLGIAVMKAKNGAYGILEGTVNIFPKNLEETIYIFGETGTVKIGGTSFNSLEEWHFSEQNDTRSNMEKDCYELPPNIYGYGHSRFYQNVIGAIVENTALLCDGYAGKNALELVLAIYKSKKEHKPIKLPLNDFSSLDMEGMF